MPLTFATRVLGDAPTYSAANIKDIFIDVSSRRIIVTLEYGDVVSSVFVLNKNVPTRQFVVDGDRWIALAATKPDALLGLYDNIKNVAWQAIVSSSFESGTVT